MPPATTPRPGRRPPEDSEAEDNSLHGVGVTDPLFAGTHAPVEAGSTASAVEAAAVAVQYLVGTHNVEGTDVPMADATAMETDVGRRPAGQALALAPGSSAEGASTHPEVATGPSTLEMAASARSGEPMIVDATADDDVTEGATDQHLAATGSAMDTDTIESRSVGRRGFLGRSGGGHSGRVLGRRDLCHVSRGASTAGGSHHSDRDLLQAGRNTTGL